MSNTKSPVPAETAAPSATVVRDGAKLAYMLQSSGYGRPGVVLVHSLAMNGAFWTPVVQRLLPYANVLTYDCRGHGTSDKPAGPYSMEQFADDLADLLDHVGWRSAVVAGASMGGSVSLAFAAAYSERVDALGLIDTTAWYGAEAPRNWGERAEKARREGLQALVGFQQTRWFSDAFRESHPDVVDACVSTFLKNDITAFEATCGMLGAFDLRPVLPRLSMPVAVVVGEEDYATPPAMAMVLHEGIPGSTIQIVKGARHLTPLEYPDLVSGVLVQLLSKENE